MQENIKDQNKKTKNKKKSYAKITNYNYNNSNSTLQTAIPLKRSSVSKVRRKTAVCTFQNKPIHTLTLVLSETPDYTLRNDVSWVQ